MDMDTLKRLSRNYLDTVDNADRYGVEKTPERHAKFMKEFFFQEKPELTTFESKSKATVTVHNLDVYAYCEHHIIPFFGHCTIKYVPDGKILGLSKFQRLVSYVSNRLHTQEGLTEQLMETLTAILETKDIQITMTCRHLCMEMRGIQKSGIETTTELSKGVFQ